MTIRPRHYARLLVEDASSDLIATRIDVLELLAAVRRQLAGLMVLPNMQTIVEKLLGETEVEELTRSIVTEPAIIGQLNWLPAIGRGVEQSAKVNGRSAVAHVRVARTNVITDTEVSHTLEPLLGQIGAVRMQIVPNQLGGIIIQVADQRFDASLDTKLARLRQALHDSSRASRLSSTSTTSRERVTS